LKIDRKLAPALLALLCPLLVLRSQDAKSNNQGAPKRWGSAPAVEFTPQRVMLGWIGDPAHTQAITWRTQKKADTPQVQFAPGDANPDFISKAATVPATATSLDLGDGVAAVTYRANLENLKPATHYLYRVGDGKNWGEWNGFRTASEQAGRFQFLYVGDAQNDIKSRWSRLIRAAYATAPQSAFVIHTGDLVSTGSRDDLWGEWHDAMGFIAATIPSMPCPGNHEIERPAGSPKSDVLPAIWSRQFSYPANGPDIPGNESYYFDYQGVRFISLNVNILAEPQDYDQDHQKAQVLSAWLERVLKNNPNRWTVAFQHQTMFSMASQRNYKHMRDVLMPLYDKYHVDLVLQGHDHLYARSKKLFAGEPVAGDAPGTIYMISVSGPKMYEIDQAFQPLMAKVITKTQMFQVIDVNGDRMTVRSYSSEGEQLDLFQINERAGHGVSMGAAAASGRR
jgi:Purple acid Phosphatase, N-terminal domain/Calcineurin-like phosphoesterase